MLVTVDHLTKRFGKTLAVDDLTFEVRPGEVTGFLGPNGSGKSTTMRCMLGLDRAEHGEARFGGRRYRDLESPLHEVGGLLDAGYVHPGRSGRNHLRWVAASNGIARSRVDEVIQLVGLEKVASSRVRGYSLGMRQRLGLASVLLGNPQVVILDEPANGLDPEGIRWIRDVLAQLATTGCTVLVSSHQLAEIALIANQLVVIGRGRLIEQASVPEFIARHATFWVQVKGPALGPLHARLVADGATVDQVDATTITVRDMDAAAIGERAAALQVVLHELSPQTGSLEDAFLSATAADQEYRSVMPPEGHE